MGIYFLQIIMTRMIINTKIFSIIKKMKKLYCVLCGKDRKFEKPKISYLIKNISSFFYLQSVHE